MPNDVFVTSISTGAEVHENRSEGGGAPWAGPLGLHPEVTVARAIVIAAAINGCICFRSVWGVRCPANGLL